MPPTVEELRLDLRAVEQVRRKNLHSDRDPRDATRMRETSRRIGSHSGEHPRRIAKTRTVGSATKTFVDTRRLPDEFDDDDCQRD